MGGLDLFGCLWLFFVYSFLGWIAETCFCVLKYRKFMNRGMLNSPLCIVYGIAAVIITIGFPELFDEVPILFLGCAGVSTLLEWFTAKILEKLDHKNGGTILLKDGILMDTSVCSILLYGVS